MKQWTLIFLMGLTGAALALPHPEFIETAQPQRHDFTETVRWFGQAVNRERIDVVALEAGRVVSIAVDDGASVQAGDLLMTLGGPQVDSRRAVLRERAASLAERLKQSKKIVEMKKEARAQKLATYEELAAAENDYTRLKTEQETAVQELAQLEAACALRAGIGGTFTERNTAVGQDIGAGDVLAAILPPVAPRIRATLFPASGTPLEKKSVWIERPGAPPLAGTITRVLPQSTPEGATVVWIEPEKPSALRSGQSVAGSVVLAEHRQALALPTDAVVHDDDGQTFIFLKTADGYRKQAVETGLVSKDWIEITSGLSEGNEVVVQGAYELFHSNFNQIYKVVD